LTGTVRAAGGIVARGPEEALQVLLVHRPRYDDWTFPKGKSDPGERDEDCALREVAEETGILCSLGDELGVTEYTDSRGRAKTVRYFSMRPLAGAFHPHQEVDLIAWMTPAEARQRLTYARDHPFLDHVATPRPPIYLTRHASAGRRGEWNADDRMRPLDERGRRQARGLVEQLEAAVVERVASSPFVRCLQSVEPLAAACGLRIERRDELAESASRADALALVHELDGTRAVLCSHGDVLELLLGDEGEKGSTRIADVDGSALRLLASLPPPA